VPGAVAAPLVVADAFARRSTAELRWRHHAPGRRATFGVGSGARSKKESLGFCRSLDYDHKSSRVVVGTTEGMVTLI